jgi:hypothetical protein
MERKTRFSNSMKKEDVIPGLVIMSVSLILILVFIVTDKTNYHDPCELHRELFLNEITSGVVIDKFIEKENHAKKKVFIKELNKTYEVSFTFYANWTDFEEISIGDSITKPPKSFHLRVNHKRDIQLDFQCDYSKD